MGSSISRATATLRAVDGTNYVTSNTAVGRLSASRYRLIRTEKKNLELLCMLLLHMHVLVTTGNLAPGSPRRSMLIRKIKSSQEEKLGCAFISYARYTHARMYLLAGYTQYIIFRLFAVGTACIQVGFRHN